MIVSPDKDVIVGVGGQVSAPLSDSQNYVITSGMSSISNYAQWGNDLIVQFSSGQELRINNFFTNGPAFHKLMLIENGTRVEVDFSHALTSTGDGIDDSLIQYTQLGESLSVTTLLGILGGVAVGGAGIYSVFGKGDDDGDNFTSPTGTAGLPDSPDADIINDDKTPSEVVRNGASTNDNTPTLQGEDAIAGGRIAIRVNGGEPIYVTVGQDGKWSYTFPELADGTYNVVITQTDSSGSTSQETNIQFIVDTVAPDVPKLDSVNDNVAPVGTIESGGITNDATPQFKGTAEAGSKISIYVDGTVVGTTTTGSDGTWAIELGQNLADGLHKVQITATDAAGNESAKTGEFSFTVDTVAPSAITASSIFWGNADGGDLTAFTSGGTVNTTIRHVVLEGTANAVGTGYDAKWIEVFDNGVSLGRAEIGSDGKWRFTSPSDLGLGSHNFSFEAIDAAGNRSSRTSVSQFIISAESPSTNSESTDTNSAPDDGSSSSSANDDSSTTRSSRSASHNQSDSDSDATSSHDASTSTGDDPSAAKHSDTGNTNSENTASTYSYKVGNYLDGSDAISTAKSSSEQSSDLDAQHSQNNAGTDTDVSVVDTAQTSDLISEMGISNSEEASQSVETSNDAETNNHDININFDDLLSSDSSAGAHINTNDTPILDYFSSVQAPVIYDEQHLSYV